MENDAVAIRTRATLELGDRLLELKADDAMSKGGRPPKTRSNSEQVSKLDLADLGIDRKLSMRAQHMATLPRQETLDAIEHWREKASKTVRANGTHAQRATHPPGQRAPCRAFPR